jgi:hypothetical protein
VTKLPWDAPRWFDDATAWIDAHVERAGDLELLRTRPWSALIRVPIDGGDLWFKEAAPVNTYEPALTALLAARRPDRVPAVLAAEETRMLTADAGPSVRALLHEDGTVPAWEDVVALYAGLQIDLADAVEDLLALGVPDSRPDTLGHPVGGSLPLTLIHEEVTDNNVHVLDGRPVFIDWAEASVSHPFAGMTNTMRVLSWRCGWEPGGPEVLRLRDAYLEPWTAYAPMQELRELFAGGYALGALARAASWDRTLAPLSPATREEFAGNADAWREIYADACSPRVKLGA